MNWYKKIVASYETEYATQVEQLSKQNPYPFKEWFDKNGRTYIPFVPGETKTDNNANSDLEVRELLERNGYTITDYRQGYCAQGKRVQRIGKVLNYLKQKDLSEAQGMYQQESDPVQQQIFQMRLQKELKEINEWHDEVMNVFVNSAYRSQQKASEFYVVISQNPHDMAQMSTGRSWTSCMELGKGGHHKDVFCEIQYGGLVAYLIQANDQDIKNPLARIHIRRFDDREGRSVAIPEQSVYGNQIQGFEEVVKEWLNQKQGDLQYGVYDRQGGEYSDSFDKSHWVPPKNPQDPKWINELLKLIRGEGRDAQYSTWAVKDELYEYCKDHMYDAEDSIPDNSRTFTNKEEAQQYFHKLEVEDMDHGSDDREFAEGIFSGSRSGIGWMERDEEEERWEKWENNRYKFQENKIDNRAKMQEEALSIILRAPKGQYPEEIIREIKPIVLDYKKINRLYPSLFAEKYPEMLSDQEFENLGDRASFFDKLPEERKDKHREQWRARIQSMLEYPAHFLSDKRVQEAIQEKQRFSTDTTQRIRRDESLALMYTVSLNDQLFTPLQKVFKPIPEPIIQQLVSFAQNFVKKEGRNSVPYEDQPEYDREILAHIIHTLSITDSDTPTVQNFYKQMLPYWSDNRDTYYEAGYNDIGITTLGYAIANLKENGRDFLPFINKKIEEEKQSLNQYLSSKTENEKQQEYVQIFLERIYKKIEQLYYIKNSVELGAKSEKYKWFSRKGNWFKKALSRLTKPDLEGVNKKRIQLFNYLKSLNIKHTFYHGTSESTYEKIKKSGYMMSPVAMGTVGYERRKKGLEQIFYTTSISYALSYAKRASGQTKTQPTILKLEIPVHLITEVRNAILTPSQPIYNEFDIEDVFKVILEKQLSEGGIEEILNHSIFSSEDRNEFTTYGILSLKYIKQVMKEDDPEFFLTLKKEWIGILGLDPLQYSNSNFPEDLKNDPEILQVIKPLWIEPLKVDESIYYDSNFPEGLRNDPEILQAFRDGWIELLKRDPSKHIFSDLPQDLKNDPDILQIIKKEWIWLLQNPQNYNNPHFPIALKNDPDILQVVNSKKANSKRSWYKRSQENINSVDNIYYHGTNSEELTPETFRNVNRSINETMFGPVDTVRHGIFLSSSGDFAGEFGKRVIKVKAKVKNIANVQTEKYNFIDYLDPFNKRDREIWLLTRNIKTDWGMFEGELGERFVKFLKEKGYDSAQFKETLESGKFSGDEIREVSGETVVVFDAKTIVGVE